MSHFDESHDMYIREKQLLLAGTAIWIAKMASEQSKNREIQDDLLAHMYNCHYADLLLQQYIDYREYTNMVVNKVRLKNAKLRVENEELIQEVKRLQGIIEENL
jgi:hypothetical protein